MAKRDDQAMQGEPAEYPLTLDEFLNEIPQSQVEMKAAFAHLAKEEGLIGHKSRAEWQKLFTLFKGKPVNQSWKDCIKGVK